MNSICRPRNGPARSRSGRSISQPRSASRRATAVLDFAVDPARDFAPERAQNANVYEAVVKHVGKLRKDKRKIILASYSRGARERLGGLLEDHGLKSMKMVDTWQEALGTRGQCGADGAAARPWLHRPRGRGADRAGHARRPAGPPQEAPQERRRLPRRARHPHPGRSRRPRRPWHRALQRPDLGPRQQGAARLRRARICRRRQALRAGREYRRADALRLGQRASLARPAGRRGVAAAQVEDEGADPRDRGRADQDRRGARHPPRPGRRGRQRLPAIRRPLPL